MESDESRASQNQDQALTTELVQGGAEMAGGVAGAAIGLIGGPVGALGGAAAGVALGRTLSRIGADLQRRVLGPRERVRIGAGMAFAAARIRERLEAGDTPRTDGFFDGNGDRSTADTLLEGVLIKSRDAYEEKKVPFLGRLYANLVFHPEINGTYAGYLVTLAGELTYTQLVALAVGQDVTRKTELRQRDYRGDDAAINALGLGGAGLLTEIYALYQRGLINGGDGSAWLSVPDVRPAFNVQGAGGVLASLMELHEIPRDDREVFYRTLGAS